MTSNLKLTCELLAGVLLLPGFLGLAAFVLAIAPDTRAMPDGPGSHASHGAASVSALRVSIPIAGDAK